MSSVKIKFVRSISCPGSVSMPVVSLKVCRDKRRGSLRRWRLRDIGVEANNAEHRNVLPDLTVCVTNFVGQLAVVGAMRFQWTRLSNLESC